MLSLNEKDEKWQILITNEHKLFSYPWTENPFASISFNAQFLEGVFESFIESFVTVSFSMKHRSMEILETYININYLDLSVIEFGIKQHVIVIVEGEL